MSDLQTLLDLSAARHSHLCPRQVIGVRMGLAGAAALDLPLPRSGKRLLIILETDGCFADGIEVATGCSIGHRTLRIEDYGKIAATFIHVPSGRALRLAPRPDIRQQAGLYAPHEKKKYFAQLAAYQRMPVDELFLFQEVQLTTPVAAIVSRPGVRTSCAACGEEIINQREVLVGGGPLCLSCAGLGYYRPLESPLPAPTWDAVLAPKLTP